LATARDIPLALPPVYARWWAEGWPPARSSIQNRLPRPGADSTPHLTAQTPDTLLHQREPDAGAGIAPCHGALEHLEDPRLLRRIDHSAPRQIRARFPGSWSITGLIEPARWQQRTALITSTPR